MDVSASTGSDQLDSTDNKSSSTTEPSTDWSLCVLCQKSSNVQLVCPADSKRKDAGAGKNDDLRSASTFGLNAKVRSATLCIGDTKLLAKLSDGDVIDEVSPDSHA